MISNKFSSPQNLKYFTRRPGKIDQIWQWKRNETKWPKSAEQCQRSIYPSLLLVPGHHSRNAAILSDSNGGGSAWCTASAVSPPVKLVQLVKFTCCACPSDCSHIAPLLLCGSCNFLSTTNYCALHFLVCLLLVIEFYCLNIALASGVKMLVEKDCNHLYNWIERKW